MANALVCLNLQKKTGQTSKISPGTEFIQVIHMIQTQHVKYTL